MSVYVHFTMWFKLVSIFIFIFCGDLTDATSSLKCRQVNRKFYYSGTRNVTKTGTTCQRWDATKPFKPHPSFLILGAYALTSMENYCHADIISPIPWCYTTGKERWEQCDLPACPIIGGWSNWVSGCCSLTQLITTGTRLMARSRKCNNPKGHHCEGDSLEIIPCPKNVKSCQNKDIRTDAKNCLGPELAGKYFYQGTQSLTKSGKTCQRWDSVVPHKPLECILKAYKDNLKSFENYCRTPNDHGVPWCYTTEKGTRWEECGIAHCDNECLGPTIKGYDYYMGNKNVTINGLTCQRWDATYPYKPSKAVKKHGKAVLKSMVNYCRTPDYYGTPWCYTMNSKTHWQECGIPKCENIDVWSPWVSGCCSLTLSTKTGRPMMTRSRKCLNTFPWTDDCEGDNFEVVECEKDTFKCTNPQATLNECITRKKDGKFYYDGTQNVTVNGIDCQPWNEACPTDPNAEVLKIDIGTLNSMNNYCRSLNGSSTQWCYTIDEKLEFDICDIPLCDA